MDIKQLCKYFKREDITVKKAIKKMCDSGFGEYKSVVENKGVISKEGVEWICKNVFKQKYLELLEKYKMSCILRQVILMIISFGKLKQNNKDKYR